MRKLVILAFVLFSFASAATAQIPTSGNLYAGYSYYNTNLGATRQSLNGWEGSIEGKFFPIPFLGIFADFSANYGDLKFPSPAGLCAIEPKTGDAVRSAAGPQRSLTARREINVRMFTC